MLNSTPFYFSSVRNLTAAFGSLFNNINIVRYNTDGSIENNIKVPLAYGSGDKTITMLQQQDIQRRENNVDIKISLPRLSFELSGMTYDSARKQQTIGKNVYIPPSAVSFNAATAVDISNGNITIPNHNLKTGSTVKYSNGGGTTIGNLTSGNSYFVISVNNNVIKLAASKAQAEAGTAINLSSLGTGTATLTSSYKYHYNPVPYNFEYTLNLYVKYIDDGLQIIEQILPYFTPFYTLTLNDITSLDLKRDVQVTLTSVAKEDTFEGTVDEDQIRMWTLTFVANAWIYPPISDSKIIKNTVTNFYELNTTQKLTTVTLTVDPITADREDNYDIIKTITEY